jgi:hypothetical protein
MVFRKDFAFLRRREFILFFLALVALAYFQFAFTRTRYSTIGQPVLAIENGFLESLGVFLPLFTAVFLFFQHKKSHSGSWVFWVIWGLILGILMLVIILLPGPSLSDDLADIPDDSTASTPDTTAFTEPITVSTPDPNPPGTAPINLLTVTNFIYQLINMVFLVILLLPLIILLLVRNKELEDQSPDSEEELHNEKEGSEFHTQTILECYYQASNALEERGANDSVTLTPSEFTTDVIKKDLTPPPNISTLTDLFEEAKFSQHKIARTHVKKAKDLSNTIIFSSTLTKKKIISQIDEASDRKRR